MPISRIGYIALFGDGPTSDLPITNQRPTLYDHSLASQSCLKKRKTKGEKSHYLRCARCNPILRSRMVAIKGDDLSDSNALVETM